MNIYLHSNYEYLLNHAGQVICVEYACSGNAHKEDEEEVPPYDWEGNVVEDLEISHITVWVEDDNQKPLKLTLDQLTRHLPDGSIEKLKSKANEKIQEEAFGD